MNIPTYRQYRYGSVGCITYKFSANDSTGEECFNVREWLVAAPHIETLNSVSLYTERGNRTDKRVSRLIHDKARGLVKGLWVKHKMI